MVEFGEKVKQVREEQGLTQQSLAERLYVTRQAVSRWECGARYPDLLTAKKLAVILNVSLDELLSGEKLRENVENEPVLTKTMENIMQTILYAVAAIIYFLLCVFSAYALLCSNEALANTPAGVIIVISAMTILYRLYHYKIKFYYFTDLGFVITTIHMVGKIGMAFLLGYQAIVWDRKKKTAYKKITL